jgi:hypothetical protein
MNDATLTSAAALEAERIQHLAAERGAIERLARLNGALELQAAVLALLLPRGSQRALRAWQIETTGTPDAEAVRAQIDALAGPSRLPMFEQLVSRLRGQAIDTRQALLEATRRVMGARGVLRPIDRLHWLAMRQRLDSNASGGTRAAATAEMSRLPQADVSAIAMFSAFLSRLVPVDASEATTATDAGDTPPGVAWYDAVMAPWQAHTDVPACSPPDTDGLVHALHELQAMAWMQRPVLVRGWVVAARQTSRYGRLGDMAADALRLTCTLLDSPLPPELARHYGEPKLETR